MRLQRRAFAIVAKGKAGHRKRALRCSMAAGTLAGNLLTRAMNWG
jgi:hypothetical protein